MFNNASIIFRTRFIDGVPAVVRTVTGAKIKFSITAAPAAVNFLTEEDTEDAPRRRKASRARRSLRWKYRGEESILGDR